MLRYELKKIFGRAGGKIALLVLCNRAGSHLLQRSAAK